MSLLPVITPRTSEPLRQQRAIFQVNSDQSSLQQLYDQLSTGRRVISGSDDPAAAARAIALKGGIAHAEQMVRNANAATGFLTTADAALSNINDSLIEARGTAVSASQNVLGEDERSALTEQMDQIIRRVLMTGNDAFRESQMFGGALYDSAPLEFIEDGILYHGNESVSKPAVARATLIETVTTGVDALGLAKPVIQGNELESALTRDSRLTDMRDGRGVEPGVLRLNDGSGWTEIDLRGSVTVGDLVDRVEAVTLNGREISVDVGVDSLTFRYADNLNGTLGIDDAPGWSTSTQLNVHNPLALIAPPLVGGNLAPRTTVQTKLADLNNGAGLDVSAGLQIGVGNETFVIDLSKAETIDQVLATINRSEAPIRAELDPTTETIQFRLLKSGADYWIGENGGQTAANLGVRTATRETRLDQLRNGRGINANPDTEPDLTISRPDGTNLNLFATSLQTVGDVIDAINLHPLNQDTRRITASLNATGNGIRITGPVDDDPIRVTQPSLSKFGNALGLIPENEDTAAGSVVGGVSVMSGVDYNPVEPEGTLDTLLRMRDAVANGELYDLERLSNRLNIDFDRSTNVQGELGFRSQTVDTLRYRAEDQTTTMKERLSDEVDADFTETISEINTRQASLEASLRVIGQTAGLTVLNFL